MVNNKVIKYTVKPRDTLTKIAKEHKLNSWREIYSYKENETFFRNPARDMNWIYTGDILFIPNKKLIFPEPS